jgi:SAM-dependent methyltransferase
VLAGGKDQFGVSSYRRLAQTIPGTPGSATVLDLACGDGYLLELVRGRLGPEARLIGVDMSPDELGVARARLGSNVELRCERAQAMTLESGSIDMVVSHMALMLMAPIDEVVREIRRVLRPGGMLAGVVGSDRRPPGAWAEFVDIARELGAASMITLGDGRMRTPAGIREVFSAATGWTEIAIEEFDLNLDGPWPQIEAFLFGTYVPDLVESALRERLRHETVARIPALADAQGIIACRAGLRQIQFRRGEEPNKTQPPDARS